MGHDYLLLSEFDVWYIASKLPKDLLFIWKLGMSLGITNDRIQKITDQLRMLFDPEERYSEHFRQMLAFKILIYRQNSMLMEDFGVRFCMFLEKEGLSDALMHLPKRDRWVIKYFSILLNFLFYF